MSKNDGVYTPHVHYRTERNGKQVISRETIEWFLNRALEYQQVGSRRPTDNFHFEISGRGFEVMIWYLDCDEDGIDMWYYRSAPEAETYTHGTIQTIRDPYLLQAKEHVEKLMDKVWQDWIESQKKEVRNGNTV